MSQTMKELKDLIEAAKAQEQKAMCKYCDEDICSDRDTCTLMALQNARMSAEYALKRIIAIDVLKLNPDHFSALPLDMAHVRPINALSGQSATIIVIPKEADNAGK